MTYPIKPQVAAQPDGSIDVFVGGAYKRLNHDAAKSLMTQLAVALRIPISEGVALFAGRMLQAHRNDGMPSDVDGGEAQEHALDSGLIEPFECPPAGCGDNCCCSEGDRCFRFTAIGRALVELIEPSDAPRAVQL